MKKVFIVIAIIIFAIFALGIVKDQIIKSVITTTATRIIGAPVHIGGFSLGIFSQSVKISGLRIYNPKGFPAGVLVDIPKIRVKYDLGGLLKKKLHLVSAEIELKEMLLQKNKEGKLNVDALRPVEGKGKEQAKPSEQMPMQIDLLKLKIGKIISKDYSASGEPLVKVYNVNMDKSYKNITSVHQLVALVLVEPMKAAGIEGAKIYGAAMLTGVAFLPVAAVIAFTGKDSAEEVFGASTDHLYDISLAVLKRKGKVNQEDKIGGTIAATVGSSQVNLKVVKKTGNKNAVVVSAREFFFPKPEIAAGILYEISEKLK